MQNVTTYAQLIAFIKNSNNFMQLASSKCETHFATHMYAAMSIVEFVLDNAEMRTIATTQHAAAAAADWLEEAVYEDCIVA